MHATSQKEEMEKEAELLWQEKKFFFLVSLVITTARPQNLEYWVHFLP